MVTSAYIGLENERLKVEIAKPGTVYAGSRFDWTGFITQVYLDKKHTFCAYEDRVPGNGSGGIGICNDFGLNKPIGYDEAAVGENYLKVGLGNVKKLEAPKAFIHMVGHEITEKAEITWENDDTSVSFHAVNPDCRGYRTDLKKKISIDGNRLRIDYTLKNIGAKTIDTEEYTHNFLAIDGKPLGKGYQVDVAFEADNQGREELGAMLTMAPMIMPGVPVGMHRDVLALGVEDNGMALENHRLTFGDAVIGQFYARGNTVDNSGAHFRLTELSSGAYIEESDSFEAPYMALWGTADCIAIEAFHNITLLPGEETSWTRTYTFDIKK